MAHRITIICDSCKTEFTMDEEMELPPYWIGCPVSIANGEGMINGEIFAHSCSLECLAEFVLSEGMKEKLMLVDKNDEDEYPDDEEVG